jgi:hypothetical protein
MRRHDSGMHAMQRRRRRSKSLNESGRTRLFIAPACPFRCTHTQMSVLFDGRTMCFWDLAITATCHP